MLTNRYLLSQKLQLIDLNEDSLNFQVEFTVTSLNNKNFYISVVDQKTLDAQGNNLEFKYVEDKTISGNILQDDNIYQNYFLCLKSNENAEVNVEINKKIIQPSQNALFRERKIKEQENYRKNQEQNILKQRQQEEYRKMEFEQRKKIEEENKRKYEFEKQQKIKQEYNNIQREKNNLSKLKQQQNMREMEIKQNFKQYQEKINQDSNHLLKIKEDQEKKNHYERKIIEEKEVELKSKEQFLINKDKLIKEKQEETIKSKINWKKILIVMVIILSVVLLYYLLSKTNKNKHNFTENIQSINNVNNDNPLIDQSLMKKLNSIQVDI
jgi:hypothetical protein